MRHLLYTFSRDRVIRRTAQIALPTSLLVRFAAVRRPSPIAAGTSALFVALAAVATWPLARHLDEALPGDLGDPLLNAWVLGWDADRIGHLFSGFWDAPIFYPYHHTLAFSEHLLGIAVPLAPLVWLTGRPLVAYNIAFIASFALAGMGMWLLVERLTGRRDAALVAGLIFAFAPVRFAQVGHLQVLMSGWMPIALWALHGYVETRSRRALAACVAAFLIEGLSNGYYIYFLALPLAAVALHALIVHAADRTRMARDFVVSALVVLVVLLPIALVYLDAGQRYGLRRTEEDVTNFGADLGAYLHGTEAIHPPISLWRRLPYVAKPVGPEGEIFPGMTALLLAGLALWPRRSTSMVTRRDVVPLYVGIGLAALVLSLGIRPTAWGRLLPIGAPYRWLFVYLPGFDGLRVPARLSVVVLLAIAVLAGVGMARLLKLLSSRLRLAVLLIVAALVLLEGDGGALPLAYLTPHGQPDRAAYTWIRDHEAGPLLELPAGETDGGRRTFQYQFQTLVHRRPIVNGASGYESALQAFIGGARSPLADFDRFGDALRMLRAIGVRTIVFHPGAFSDRGLADATLDALQRDREQASETAAFPGLVVFRLAPWRDDESAARGTTPTADAEPRPIGAASFRAEASHNPGALARAFDGDLETRWLTGTHQVGDEWIQIAFDRPRDVARVRILTSRRSFGDYPRELVVETADGQEPFRPLYRGTVVVELAQGLVRDPLRGPIDIPLPPNRTTRLRIRQLGQTRTWFWAVDELSFWER